MHVVVVEFAGEAPDAKVFGGMCGAREYARVQINEGAEIVPIYAATSATTPGHALDLLAVGECILVETKIKPPTQREIAATAAKRLQRLFDAGLL